MDENRLEKHGNSQLAVHKLMPLADATSMEDLNRERQLQALWLHLEERHSLPPIIRDLCQEHGLYTCDPSRTQKM